MNHGIILTILGTVLVMQKTKVNRRTPTILSMEKNPIRARELLIWIQRSIPDKFPFLLKDKDGNTNVVPLNQFLSRHRITSFILRKIGAVHASRVHGDHALSVEHYGVMNDRPNTPAPKQENSEIEDIIDFKSLFDKLEEDYGVCDFDENLYGGVVAVPVENLYRDVIGEIKDLDLQFHYKRKWQSLDCTELIDFQIRKNPSFDLVLGQNWLCMRKAKISFGFSSETCSHNAKIVIDETNSSNFNSYNHPRKKKCTPSHFMTTSDLRPKPDLTLEELTNMLKKLSLGSKDNKYQKRYHRIFHNIPPTSRRSNDDFSRDSKI
ncbi:hypothetical protein F8M41_006923 [Gigaspora margarita]|uniref:Uncharacterized protein n=1 Tax=Gigaspora margarita TaxID=4874 RepID=A0A8H4A3D4_GIGMA|nr:hypothetical protein F8M41_006923 [Gigaspora margarita]